MFIDTSALVAILAKENDALSLLSALEDADAAVTSPVVILEATMRLATMLRDDPLKTLANVEAFLATSRIEVMPIDAEHARVAVQAFAVYGKGRGHPAQLNFGDCLSYACAKSRGLSMLYKGEDFARTDMAGRS